MKLRKMIPVLILAVLLGLWGWKSCQDRRAYEAQFITLDEVRYEKAAQDVDLSGRNLTDLEALKAFTNPKKLDLRDTGITAEQYETLKSWFPEAEILWDIPFQGAFYPMDTEELTVTGLNEEDLTALDYFAALQTLSAEGCPDYRLLHELRTRRPELKVTYSISVAGTAYPCDAKELVLPGEDAAALAELVPYFTELERLELMAPLAPVEALQGVAEAVPGVQLRWNLEVAGVPVDNSTETLDLTGLPVTVEEMDAVLPYLTGLTYVDMTDCGISDEEMDALNSRYEDIKIVWTVTLGKGFRVRTDITAFMPVRDDYYPSGEDLNNLRYCHDIIAIDVGHRGITNCEFAAYMPHLQFLILADTNVRDLTPLTGLKELKYLELFQTNYQDLTPLLTTTALEDLNLCYTSADVEIVAQITWLKNLWWSHTEKRQLTMAQQQLLRDSIPGCNFMLVPYRSSTGDGWRELPNYFAQRDIFGVGYMKG